MLELILTLAGVVAIIVGIYYIATGNLLLGVILVAVGLVVAGAFGRTYSRRGRL